MRGCCFQDSPVCSGQLAQLDRRSYRASFKLMTFPAFASLVPPASLSQESNFGRADRCMKVCKHLKLNKNPASALPGVRPLGTLAFFLFVSSFPVQAASLQEIATPKTFADWCLNKANLSVQTKRTVDALLLEAETEDCNQADKRLSTRTSLFLRDSKITDLRPLSTLTSLTELSLENNQIADLKPLSTLSNLTLLYLSNNQIADIRPLSTLSNLTVLYLHNNQIVDLRPLSTLTNLTNLYLHNNQIADLRPLSTLNNLTKLYLENNEITDLRPLSTLTNLTNLYLSNNEIADLRPLSTLTNLTTLYLSNNQTLVDKTCPVKPASICIFGSAQVEKNSEYRK